jgi:hypothetical protein
LKSGVFGDDRQRGDARVELDVATQIEPVGDVVGVTQDLGLGGVALGPFPVLLQRIGELVGILHALDVAPRTGIAVPVPGAADAAAGFQHGRLEAQPAQPMQQVHAREPGADDDGVMGGLGFCRHASTRSFVPNVFAARAVGGAIEARLAPARYKSTRNDG